MKRREAPSTTTAFTAPLPAQKPASYLVRRQRGYPEAPKHEWFAKISALLHVQFTWGDRLPLACRRLAAVNATKDAVYRRYFRRPRQVLEAADAFHVGPASFALERDGRRLGQLARELVFDIDLPDLDTARIRTCACAGQKRCCKDCWQQLVLARLTLERRLEWYWGVRGLLWVFSGSKGVHATSNSRIAALFDRSTRQALVATLVQPFDYERDRDLLRDLATLARRHVFRDDVQGWLGRPAFRARLLEELAAAGLDAPLRHAWDTLDETITYQRSWIEELFPGKEYRRHCKRFLDQLVDQPWTQCFWNVMRRESAREAWAVICSCFFIPYLDAAVTEDPEHLNKAAFAIHSGTARVALPLDRPRFIRFDPDEVPTVDALLADSTLAAQWLGPALDVYDTWLRNAGRE